MEELKKIITDKGLLVNGLGILPGKLDDLIKKQDRTNFLLSMIEKKIEAGNQLLSEILQEQKSVDEKQ